MNEELQAARLVLFQNLGGLRALLRSGNPLSQEDRDAVATVLDQTEEFIDAIMQELGEGGGQ